MPTASTSIPKGEIDDQAKFESMIGHSKKAQIFRRHQDLSRDHEKQMRMLEKETKLTASSLIRAQAVFEKKMKFFEEIEEHGLDWARKSKKVRNRHQIQVAPPKLHIRDKRVLLFRVERNDGVDNYIYEAKKKPDFKEMFLCSKSGSDKGRSTSSLELSL